MTNRIVMVCACLAQLSSVAAAAVPEVLLLRPAQVSTVEHGDTHSGWTVWVEDERIAAAGPAESVKAPKDARVIDLSGAMLLQGLTDAHADLVRQSDRIDRIRQGLLADLVAVEGNSSVDVKALRKARQVLKDGYVEP